MNENDTLKNQRTNLITMLYKRIGDKLGAIHPAPPRLALKVFGGTMTIDDFRKESTKGHVYCTLSSPLIPINPIVEKNINFAWVSSDDASDNFNQFDTEIKEEQLKIKKKFKPKNAQSTLEQSLGIFT